MLQYRIRGEQVRTALDEMSADEGSTWRQHYLNLRDYLVMKVLLSVRFSDFVYQTGPKSVGHVYAIDGERQTYHGGPFELIQLILTPEHRRAKLGRQYRWTRTD